MADAKPNSDSCTTAAPIPNPPRQVRRRMRVIVPTVAVLVIVVSVGAFLGWRTGRCPLSCIKPEDVTSIQVICGQHMDRAVFFQLEPKSIPDLLAALTPCERDWHPANWQVLGLLGINLKNGSCCAVELFTTDEELAAFSIGRTYYRGGSERKLKRLLMPPKGVPAQSGPQTNFPEIS